MDISDDFDCPAHLVVIELQFHISFTQGGREREKEGGKERRRQRKRERGEVFIDGRVSGGSLGIVWDILGL